LNFLTAKPGYKKAIALALTRFSLILLGADTLKPQLIWPMQGETEGLKLFTDISAELRTQGDPALICHCDSSP
jgi:hypothetical protein